MKGIELTIFTPTYNRLPELKRLYNSLCIQTNKKFVWLIIDDGSSENISDFIFQIKEEKKIVLEFIRQKNSGKFVAMQRAISACKTKYLCCVDSDDYFMNKKVITAIYDSISVLSSSAIGIIFPHNKKINKNAPLEVDIQELSIIANKIIETTIVHKTETLKKLHIKSCTDEKFMSEEVIYNKLSHNGKFLFIDNPIVKSEYLPSGYTNNLYRLWKSNYNNTMTLLYSRYYYLGKYPIRIRIVKRIKCILNIEMIKMSCKKNPITISPNLFLSTILFPISVLYFIYRKLKGQL